jgi:[ribosomal protein S5]-alanine N-acetyltransferase
MSASHRVEVEAGGRSGGSITLAPVRPGEAELTVDLRGGSLRAAAEAARRALEWAFTDGAYAVVHWHARSGDFAARRVVWQAGFTFGPTVPRVVDGAVVDCWTGWATADESGEPTTRWLESELLETPRLRLRPWRETDGEALVEASNDPVLRHFVPYSPLPRHRDAVPAHLARIGLAAADGHRVAWCVADGGTDAALGNVAVFELDGPPGRLEAQVGYWARPTARGRGVMAEAVRRAADWALDPAGLDLHRLYLLTSASNAGSRRVAERAGFTRVGTERDNGPVGDGWEDSVLYDRLRDD